MTRYVLELADARDDAALRQRMAEDVLDGSIAVTFRREPRYFAGTAIQGAKAQVIKCVDRDSNQIVGLATRATLPAYINGEIKTLGYLCDLRASPAVRGGTLLARGYKMLKSLHDAAPVDFYYTMILSDNDVALTVLTSGRASLPSYRPYGEILTPAIHLDQSRRYTFSKHLHIVKGSALALAEIVGFVNTQYRQKQFAPVYRTADFATPRLSGLQRDDIYVALQGGRIVGCVACWDQSHVRQIWVEKYDLALRLARPFYNLAAGYTARKPLPPQGARLPFFYLAWTAIERDDPAVFRELLETIYADRRRGPWHFFIAGLHRDSPLVAPLRAFRCIASAGKLFIVHWDDGWAACEQLDQRIPHIEVGAL